MKELFEVIKSLFIIRKADIYMWSGVGIFSLILIIAFSVISASGGLVIKDLIGLVVVLIIPGYTVAKLYLDDIKLSDNLTKNEDINKAIDLLILSIGISISTIIPMNFVWNYVLTMGFDEGGSSGATDIKGNVDEEEIYSGSASYRSLFTVILVVGLAIAYKVIDAKRKAGGSAKAAPAAPEPAPYVAPTETYSSSESTTSYSAPSDDASEHKPEGQ